MEKEKRGLKSQLNKGQSNFHSSKMESEDMKSQIQMLCKKLSQTLDDLEVQRSYRKTLEGTLQKMHEDKNLMLEETESQLFKCSKMNDGLQKELEAMQLEVRLEKQLRKLAEHNTETTTESLKVQFSDKETAEFEATESCNLEIKISVSI